MGRFNTKIIEKQFGYTPKIKSSIDDVTQKISNPPAGSIVMNITPKVADYILYNLNKGNRTMKRKAVGQYVKDMRNDNWLNTGDAIKFGTDGLLKDGQHRLQACIEANRPFCTHVAFGINPDSFHVMDTGTKRSAQDVLYILGVPNSKLAALTIKTMHMFKTGHRGGGMSNMSNEDVKQHYLNINKDLFERALRASAPVYAAINFPRSYTSALYYIVSDELQDEFTVAKFLDELAKGIGKSQRAAIPYMLKTYNQRRSDPLFNFTQNDYNNFLIRTWMSYKANRNMTKSELYFGKRDSYPNIVGDK
jgi:hypothetical protein